MKPVDHKLRQKSGVAITEAYLRNECLDTTTKCYHSVNYDGSFRDCGYHQDMLTELCLLQNYYCCYCMRRIGENQHHATLEHIIPQSLGSTFGLSRAENMRINKELSDYYAFGHDAISLRRVRLTAYFLDVRKPRHIPPYPHTVAYHNFAMSCDGSFLPDTISSASCNNPRGNKLINPVYLASDIEAQVEYNKAGAMLPKSGVRLYTDITLCIDKAKLNCKQLTEIRRLWYEFRKLPLQDLYLLQNFNEITRRGKLVAKLMPIYGPKESSRLAQQYARISQWATFLAYDWFHSYYSSNYP